MELCAHPSCVSDLCWAAFGLREAGEHLCCGEGLVEAIVGINLFFFNVEWWGFFAF